MSPSVAESVPIDPVVPAASWEAGVTSLTCNGIYDADRECITLESGSAGEIEIPCTGGVLDLSKFSSLTELEINHCPIIKSIKFPVASYELGVITLNRCENLGGDIDLSECANISAINIIGARKIYVTIPAGDAFESLYIADCQDPEVVATGGNGRLEIEFGGCKFSQDTLARMTYLRGHCKVSGLPLPEPGVPSRPTIEVRVPKPPAYTQTQAAAEVKPAAVERAIPVGIQNLSTSCYAASLMQLLFQNRQFREAVAELCEKIPTDNDHQKLLHCINAIFTHLQSGNGPCPTDLMRKFLQLEHNLGFHHAFSQEDSTLLRNDIMVNLKKLFSSTSTTEIMALKDKLLPEFMKFRTVEPLAQTGPYKTAYFGGPYGTERYGAIEIFPDAKSLEAALEECFSTRELTGNDQYRNGKERVDARESIRIHGEPPEVLTFDVRRVRYDNGRKCQVKNTIPFTFPERIDMRKHTTNPNGRPCEFELDSVIAHNGTAGSGHYISYVKRNGQWHKCNDGSVQQVSWTDVEKLFDGKGGFHATMLSYAKCNS
jgi:ubiquitin C-terminal hydrolase